MRNKILPLILAVLLLACMSATAAAHPVPDVSKTGSISLTMHCGEIAVGGGSVMLYRVGQLQEDNGDFSFALTESFAGSGVTLDDLQSSALAEALAQYAKAHSLAAKAQNVDAQGNVIFTDLELGLYLLVQDQPAAGYNAAAPFLVSVPMLEGDAYIYAVDASPKVELEKEPVTQPSEPQKPTDPMLPQTGQLNWPIPLLAAAGLVFLAVGWALCAGSRKKSR